MKSTKPVEINSWFGNLSLKSPNITSEAKVVEGEINPYDLLNQDQLDPATRLLRRLARKGNGRHVKLTKYSDIPRALSRLLAGY